MTGNSDEARVQDLLTQNSQLKSELEGCRIATLDCVDKFCAKIQDLEGKNTFARAVTALETNFSGKFDEVHARLDAMEEKIQVSSEKVDKRLDAIEEKMQISSKKVDKLQLQSGTICGMFEDLYKKVEKKVDKVHGVETSHFGEVRKDCLKVRQMMEKRSAEEEKRSRDVRSLLGSVPKVLTDMRAGMMEMSEAIVGRQLAPVAGKQPAQAACRILRDEGCQTEPAYRCSLCDVQFSAPIPYLVHQLSSYYYMRLKESLAAETDKELNGNPNQESLGLQENCEICGLFFSTREAWLKHLTTKPHLEKVVAQLKEECGEKFFKVVQENLGSMSKRPMVVEVLENALGKPLLAPPALPPSSEQPIQLDEGCSREADVRPAKRRRSVGQEESAGVPYANSLAVTPYTVRQGQEDGDLFSAQPSNLAQTPVQQTPLVETPTQQQQNPYTSPQFFEGFQQTRVPTQPAPPTPRAPYDALLQEVMQYRQMAQGNQIQEILNLLRNQQR